VEQAPKRPKLKLAEKSSPAAKVLEKEKAEKPDKELFVDFFSPKAADLITLNTDPYTEPAPDIKQQTALKPEVTSSSQIKNNQIKNVGTRTAAKPLEKKNPNIIRNALAVVLFLIIGFGVQQRFFSSGARSPSPVSDAALQQISDRVSFHKNEIGRRLNRERINVEYENQKTAPPIQAETKSAAPDMMSGLPLSPEKQSSYTRDRLEPADPDFADTRIEYTLREQQGVNEWDASARKEYVDDFVANAAKAGYKVRVEKDGKVKVVGRLPTSAGQAGPSFDPQQSLPKGHSSGSNLPQ
jgi:hypothetical protein